MKKSYLNQTDETLKAAGQCASNPDTETTPTAKSSDRPRKVTSISNLRKNSQPWPWLFFSQAESLERFFYLLETARTLRINSTLIQAVLALHFRQSREVYLSDLAEVLRTTTATVTGVADQLEELGLATRRASDLDRRKITISLTPHGCSFVIWINQVLTGESALSPSDGHM